MAGVQPRGNGSKVLVILISIIWLLFLAGILGYNPYMKRHVPSQLEQKTEKMKSIYEQQQPKINQ